MFSPHPAVTEPSEAGRKGKTKNGKNKFFRENFEIFWKIKNGGQSPHSQSLIDFKPLFKLAFWKFLASLFTHFSSAMRLCLCTPAKPAADCRPRICEGLQHPSHASTAQP